ncbi:hypothetical protein GCU56_18245 [Geodermatophilus sabuli]|uniref:Uncharacterized protein n=1 Tax=Geodermatophilus sabuli TaxID=1564158 RepID=A0A7K3W536_9ACTN|nr:hypothetical protein [Geodermatophilus sabuli]NEK59800.1 hypothetical protein [Geodermatophilus sabuli]
MTHSVASSLDGYHTDAQGGCARAGPDEEVVAASTADAAGASTVRGRRRDERWLNPAPAR